MKKIKNIRQLKARKVHLKKRQDELEKAIKYDWLDLKESLRPGNAAQQVLSAIFKKGETRAKESFVTDTVSSIAAGFTRKLVGKTASRISEWFKK